jgi:hypothetical protein
VKWIERWLKHGVMNNLNNKADRTKRNNHFLVKWSEMSNHKWKDSNQWEDNSILTKWEDNNKWVEGNSHQVKWKEKINYQTVQWSNKDHKRECNTKENQFPLQFNML